MRENDTYFIPYTRINSNQVQSHTLVISAFGRCRQEDLTLNLSYTVSSKPAFTTFDPVSKKKKSAQTRPGTVISIFGR